MLTFLLGGIFQIVFGILNISRYIKFLPYPVISGFMSGVGLIIVLLQIYPFVGVAAPKTTIAVFTEITRFLENLSWPAIGLGLFTVAVYYLFPRITKAIPSALVALISATLLSVLLQFDVPVIGEIPSGLPSLKINALLSVDSGAYLIILEYALILAVLGEKIAPRRVEHPAGDRPPASPFDAGLDPGRRCAKGGRGDAAPVEPVGLLPDAGRDAGIAGQAVDVHIVGQLLARVQHPDRHAIRLLAAQGGPQAFFAGHPFGHLAGS